MTHFYLILFTVYCILYTEHCLSHFFLQFFHAFA